MLIEAVALQHMAFFCPLPFTGRNCRLGDGAQGLGCVKTPAKPDGGENLSSFPKV
jgi:hypothetical protein